MDRFRPLYPPRQPSVSRLQQLLANYLESGQGAEATLETRLVNAFTALVLPAGLAVACADWLTGNHILALLMLSMSFVAILNVVLLRKLHDTPLASSLILLISLPALGVMLLNEIFSAIGAFWLAVYPVVAVAFKGTAGAKRWIGALLLMTAILYLGHTRILDDSPFTPVVLTLLIIGVVCVTLLIYSFEYLRKGSDNEISRKQRQLQQMAHTDLLTGLPNRSRFYTLLVSAMETARSHNRHLALLFIDLDNFKPVNDRYGHEVGDRLLTAAAARMKNQVREGDTLARYGGDEFVLILTSIVDESVAKKVADKLIEVLTPSFSIDGHTCHIGASIGIAYYPGCVEDEDDLVRLADHAMYSAKHNGKNSVVCCPYNSDSSHPLTKDERICSNSC